MRLFQFVYVTVGLYCYEHMYDYLLDYPDRDTVQPRIIGAADTRRADSDLFTSRYQRERQRVYDRALHMVNSAAYAHGDVEDAKAEAALVREQAKVSRARGGQIGWVRHMLRRGAGGPVRIPEPRGDGLLTPSTYAALSPGTSCIWPSGWENSRSNASAAVRCLMSGCWPRPA